MYQKILAALEGKETDEAVVAHARRLAAQMNAQVTLLRVVAVADDGGGGLGRQFQLEIGSSGWRRKNQAEADLSRLERRLGLEGLCVETALVIGTRFEADEIVSYAAENNCDLIAMANDSRPWYRRWIGGSPATGVYRKATVPTLFVSDGTRKAPVTHAAPDTNTMMAIFGSADL
jgi:nucleotide-binding universal stress UspA family protein